MVFIDRLPNHLQSGYPERGIREVGGIREDFVSYGTNRDENRHGKRRLWML